MKIDKNDIIYQCGLMVENAIKNIEKVKLEIHKTEKKYIQDSDETLWPKIKELKFKLQDYEEHLEKCTYWYNDAKKILTELD